MSSFHRADQIFRILFASREQNDRKAEAKAASDLGAVYHKMGDFDAAIAQHRIDLDLSSNSNGGNGEDRY